MSKLNRAGIAVLAIVAMIATSGIALAEHEEDHAEDTSFSFGYDEANQILSVHTGANDGLYVCEFENGVLTAQYGDANEEGVIPVDSLEDEGGAKEFNPRLQHELEEGLTEATEPFAYAGADGECKVNGVAVAGPNGQINHGQFMKAFKSLIDFKGHGCLNRYLAQSDLGKTDATKVRTSDVDPEFTAGTSGEVSFVSFEADCVHGKKDKTTEEDAEAKVKGNSKAKKDKSEKGKSASAPGKNK